MSCLQLAGAAGWITFDRIIIAVASPACWHHSTLQLEKFLAWMWVLLAVFSLPAIVINTYGPGYRSGSGQPANPLSMSTLRNLYFNTDGNGNGGAASHFQLPLGYTISQTRAAVLYTGCDFIATFLLIIGILWMRRYVSMERRAADASLITASQYAVTVTSSEPLPADLTEDRVVKWVNGVTQYIKPSHMDGGDIDVSIDGGKLEHGRMTVATQFPVVDICISTTPDSGTAALIDRHGAMLQKLAVLEQRLEAKQTGTLTFAREVLGCFSAMSLETDLVQLTRRLQKCTDRLLELKSQRGKTGDRTALQWSTTAVFITFEHSRDADTFIDCYRGGTVAYLSQPAHLRLERRQVQVERAPDPWRIHWKNLEGRPALSCRRCFMSTLSSSVGLALVILSFIVLYFSSWQTGQYQTKFLDRSEACTSNSHLAAYVQRYNVYHSPQEEWSLRNGTTDAASIFCICNTLPWYDWDANADVSSDWFRACTAQACDRLAAISSSSPSDARCSDLRTSKASANVLVVASSFAIVIVNQWLGIAIRYIAEYEGHHSVDEQERSVATRLFLCQFFNTAVLTVLINIAWPGWHGAGPIRARQYLDTNPGWYDGVGAVLMVTMLINWVSPHVGYLAGLAWLQVRRRIQLPCFRRCWTIMHGVLSDSDAAVEAHLSRQRPSTDLAASHARLLHTAFVTFAFSTGMPLLNLIGAVSFVLGYWLDKLVFACYYDKRVLQRAPVVSTSLATTTALLLPYAILLHLALGVWMLGGIDTFNSNLAQYLPQAYYGEYLPSAGGISGGGVVVNTGSGSQVTFTLPDGQLLYSVADLQQYYLDRYSPPPSAATIDYQTAHDRITSPAAVPLLLLFVVFFVYLVTDWMLQAIGVGAGQMLDLLTCGRMKQLWRLLRSYISNDADDRVVMTPPFTVAAASKHLRGTSLRLVGAASYNAMAQPDIRHGLQMVDLHVAAAAAAAAGSGMPPSIDREAAAANGAASINPMSSTE